MAKILLIESDAATRNQLVYERLPRTDELHMSHAADLALGLLADFAADGKPVDIAIIGGAVENRRSGDRTIDTTLDFLRQAYQAYGCAMKVLVMSDGSEDGPTANAYRQAYPGCQVYNKAQVLDGSMHLIL